MVRGGLPRCLAAGLAGPDDAILPHLCNLVVHLLMPRMGKKTLYLDLDALERIEASLALIPGKPSLSAFLSEQFPPLAENLETMVSLMLAPSVTLETLRAGLNAVADDQLEMLVAAKKMIRDIPPKETVIDVTASKPKRQKKSA